MVHKSDVSGWRKQRYFLVGNKSNRLRAYDAGCCRRMRSPGHWTNLGRISALNQTASLNARNAFEWNTKTHNENSVAVRCGARWWIDWSRHRTQMWVFSFIHPSIAQRNGVREDWDWEIERKSSGNKLLPCIFRRKKGHTNRKNEMNHSAQWMRARYKPKLV